MKISVIILLLFLYQVSGTTIAAKGSFYRSITSQETIPNGGKLSFSFSADGTNTNFFALQSGDVKIIKSGVYLLMAEAPFTGAAQMEYFVNDVEIYDTVVGQDNSGVLSATTILTVANNAIISWKNPSGHTNTIPSSLTSSHKIRLTIIGLDNIQGSTPVLGYIDLARKATDVENFLYAWEIHEEKTIDVNNDQVLFVNQGIYMISYQFNPIHAEQKILNPYVYESAAGRNSLYSQLSNRFIIHKDYNPPTDYIWFPGSITQNIKSGGVKDVYNSLTIVLFDDTVDSVFGNFPLSNPPNGPHNLLAGDKVPIGNCIKCQGGVTKTSATTWNAPSGIYLVVTHFNFNTPSLYAIKRATSSLASGNTQSAGFDTQTTGAYLMSVSSQYQNSIEMLTAGIIPQHAGVSQFGYPTLINFYVLKL